MLQTFVFLAGGRQIDAKGSFFRYESGSSQGADEAIGVRADGNDLGMFVPGDSVDLPVTASRWEILPASPNTTGSVRIGLGRVVSARVAGTVRVIDSAKGDTINGVAYTIQTQLPGVAGQFARIGVWNPAGSGKRGIIERIDWSTSAAAPAGVGTIFAAPANVNNGVVNKLVGAPQATGVQRAFENNAVGSLSGIVAMLYSFEATTQKLIEPKRPIVIPPGAGIVVTVGTANVSLTANFDLTEEANI